jgi:urease subunit beta
VVENSGDRPIQVGSHYHFAETNAALRFDRAGRARHAAEQRRRAPRCASSRVQQRTVLELVDYAGDRHVWGVRGEVQGALP